PPPPPPPPPTSTLSLHDALPISDDADDSRARAERTQVRQNVRRASEMNGLAPDVNYGDGRFRRDARHVAPHELVEHHVAEDDDQIGRAHVLTPVTVRSRMPSSA